MTPRAKEHHPQRLLAYVEAVMMYTVRLRKVSSRSPCRSHKTHSHIRRELSSQKFDYPLLRPKATRFLKGILFFVSIQHRLTQRVTFRSNCEPAWCKEYHIEALQRRRHGTESMADVCLRENNVAAAIRSSPFTVSKPFLMIGSVHKGRSPPLGSRHSSNGEHTTTRLNLDQDWALTFGRKKTR